MKKKLKTLKAFSKRVKKTKYNFVRKQMNKGHLMRKKNSKRRRHLSQTITLSRVQQTLARQLVIQ